MKRPLTANDDQNREVPLLPPPQPLDAGVRLYPDVSAPPGSVPHLDQPLIGNPFPPQFPQPIGNGNRLPPIQQPFDAAPGTNGPPPYGEPQNPFGGCGQGQHIGVRYFVHGPPQMSEFHAIHTVPVPGGGANPTGCSAPTGGGLLWGIERNNFIILIVFRDSLLLCFFHFCM